MKFKVVFWIVSVCEITACVSSKTAPYNFPDAMSPAIRQEFVKQCDKGKILYEINCAKCHNVKMKRTVLIPDFNPKQLIGYELRIANAQHESEIPESNVSAEEMGLIMTFLSYKPKSGVPMKKETSP